MLFTVVLLLTPFDRRNPVYDDIKCPLIRDTMDQKISSWQRPELFSQRYSFEDTGLMKVSTSPAPSCLM